MLAFRSVVILSLFVASTAISHATEFPTEPPKLKDAEAQGLSRVSTDELKQFMPGKVDAKGPIGRRIKTFKSDGTVDTVGYKGGNAESGTWRFDEANNTYCHKFQGKKGPVDDCFAVFRAPDDVHFFDYNVKTGFFEHTWRRVTE
jgi:hypothetical protein